MACELLFLDQPVLLETDPSTLQDRAEWRRHGFVSLDAEDRGCVGTKPLRMGAPTQVINADAGRGRLRVALFEVDGRPISGYSLEECRPLTADTTRWTACWQAGTSVPMDRPVCVLVEMDKSRLFSISSGRSGL